MGDPFAFPIHSLLLVRFRKRHISLVLVNLRCKRINLSSFSIPLRVDLYSEDPCLLGLLSNERLNNKVILFQILAHLNVRVLQSIEQLVGIVVPVFNLQNESREAKGVRCHLLISVDI